MGRYLLRRLLIAIPSLNGISIVLFTVLALAPGDPFSELATSPDVPPEVRAGLRVKFGLDDPIPIRYLRWFAAMLHGEWGFSFVSRVDVDTLILPRLPTTIPPCRWPAPSLLGTLIIDEIDQVDVMSALLADIRRLRRDQPRNAAPAQAGRGRNCAAWCYDAGCLCRRCARAPFRVTLQCPA